MTERRGNRITDVLSCYDGLARCMIEFSLHWQGPRDSAAHTFRHEGREIYSPTGRLLL